MNKICKICGETKELASFSVNRLLKSGRSTYCKKCCANYNKVYRKQNQDMLSEYRRSDKTKFRERTRYANLSDISKKQHLNKRRELYRRYRQKYQARDRLKYAVKIGVVVKSSCVICGEVKSEAHHFDYTKPLDVVWLCKKHHGEAHRKNVKK